jgi:hypothetical protein
MQSIRRHAVSGARLNINDAVDAYTLSINEFGLQYYRALLHSECYWSTPRR